MKLIFIISATTEHFLAANAHLNDNTLGTKIILGIVIVLFILGLLSFGFSLIQWLRDRDGLNIVRQMCGAEELIELGKLENMVKDTRISSTLVHERLETIVDMFHSAGDGTVAQPKLQDLHRMSEQSMFSRRWVACLRLMTNVLLIVGICGTLVGVHDALGTEGAKVANIDLNLLAKALGPSKCAVAGTIFLLFFRSIFEAMVERHICDMDSFTMSRLLPYLQGTGTEQSTLKSLNDSIREFNKTLNSCKDMISGMKSVSDTLSQPPPAFEKMKIELESMHVLLQTEEDKQQKIEEQEQEEINAASSLLSKLRASLENMTTQQKKIAKEWTPLQKNLSSINADMKLVTNAGSSIEKLIEQVNSASKQLETAEAIQQDTSKLREELGNAAAQVSGELESTRNALELLDTHTEQIQQQVDALQNTRQDLKKVVEDAGAHVSELASSADSFVENIKVLEQEVVGSVNKIDAATQEVENAAKDGVLHLDSIHSRVKKVLKKAETAPMRRKRVKS